jgi:hypothetical protein
MPKKSVKRTASVGKPGLQVLCRLIRFSGRLNSWSSSSTPAIQFHKV